MPHFFLHLHNAHLDVPDEDGCDLASQEAAHEAALRGIRDFIGHEAATGKIDLRGRIDIADASGAVLQSVQFKDAFELRGF